MGIQSKVTAKSTVDQAFGEVRALARNNVLVGFPGKTGSRSDGPLNNPTLAYIHDKGSPANNIPARPFMETGVKTVQAKLERVFEAGAKAAINGDKGAADKTLNQVGLLAQDAVQQKIVEGPFVPLKPATIKAKGSSRPLIDTGALRQAVTYEIRPKG